MPSQPADDSGSAGLTPRRHSERSPQGRATSLVFPPDEWLLVTRLPARIVIAVSLAEPDPPWRTVAQGIAGLDAIAAGRIWDSDLVRAVVAAIYAEDGGDRATEHLPCPGGDLSGTLAACRAVRAVLVARADPGDCAVYCQWLEHIALRMCAVPRTGGVPRGGVAELGAGRISRAEQYLLTRLAAALRG
jgi:hypothetical protein